MLAARSRTACMQLNKDCMPGRLNNLKVEEKLVNIAKGGTRSPEYREINPLGKLPCLQVLYTGCHPIEPSVGLVLKPELCK